MYLAASSGGGGYVTLLMFALLIGAMYFLMIRPQQRRRREVERMQSTIAPGAEVVTIGGLYGTVVDIDDETVDLEIAPDVVSRYARAAIARVVSAPESESETDEAEAEETEEPADKADSDAGEQPKSPIEFTK